MDQIFTCFTVEAMNPDIRLQSATLVTTSMAAASAEDIVAVYTARGLDESFN